MGELGECRLIQNSMKDINATYREVISNLSGSSSFMGISPMFDAHFPEIVVSIARRNIPVSIILTQEIYKKVKEEYADALQAYLKCENVGLYVIDDARLAFVVTDTFVSISLYNKNSGFDVQTNLMGIDRTALKWGEDLFEDYKQRSRQIKP
jgi:predicted transcriptional regulator